MDVDLIKENDDGSADYHIKMSDEEQAQLFRFAFMELLKRGIQEGKQYECSEFSVGNTGCGESNCKDGTGEQSCESGQCSFCPKAPKVSD
jgi:hypothetical protein